MSAWIGIVVFAATVAGIAPLRAEPIDAIELALRAEDYTRADLLTRQSIAESEREHGIESLQLLQAIDRRVELLLESEQHELPEAAELIRQERALARKLAGEATRETARARMREAQRDFQRANYAAFGIAIAAAMAASRDFPAADPDRAEIELLAGQGDYQVLDRQREGMQRAARALDMLRTAQATRPRSFVRALCIYGRMKRDVQETEESVQLLRECEQRARELFGADSGARSGALSLLGYALRETGEYAAGIDMLNEAVDIAARKQPYNQSLHTRALVVLSLNLEILGDLTRAGKALETANSLQEGRPTLNAYEHALLLGNLATHYYYVGDLQRALDYDKRALPLFERVLGANAPRARIARINHAALLQEIGQLDVAADIYVKEIATHEAAHQPGDGPLLSYANLAEIRLRQRRYAESELWYERFLRRFGEGRDFAETTPSGALAGIAAARWGQARHAAAFEALQRAQKSSMRVRRAALGELSERQMLSLSGMNSDYGTLAVAIAADSRDPILIEQAWQLVLEADGALTHHAALRLAEANTRRAGVDNAAWAEWRAASGILSSARVAATKTPSKEAIAALDRVQNRVDRAERRIAATDARAGRTLSAEFNDLAGVRTGLAPDTALLRFVEIDVAKPESYRNDHRGEDSELLALVAEHGRRARAVSLGPTREIGERVERWYALAARDDGDPQQTIAAGLDLRNALIAPLTLDARVARVLLVPSASLHRLNFAALVGEDGRYLAEIGPSFHLLNHEREMLLPRADAKASGLLLAGAAANDDEPAPKNEFGRVMRKACPGLGADSLGPLPGAASELAMLGELAQNRVGKIALVSGADATETAVRNAMPGNSIIHLATHAFAFGDHCASGDALRSIALDLPPADGKPMDLSNLPNLSALAFLPGSGAVADDGLLTSEEIATLNLSAADWVVLSACETALGKVQGGEGVFGLRRAFRLAGARAVVMSLWKVEDRATAEFMRELYKARLIDGKDTPDSMQAAMRATLVARRERGESTHPLYWAGFVAAGAWR